MHELRQPICLSRDPHVFQDIRWGWEDVGERYLRPAFRTVTFDPNRVTSVYWWSEGFAPEWLAAHGQFAFVMDAPDAVTSDQGEGDLGFVFTVQPFFREGEKFRILRGFRRGGSYPILHLVTSLRDRVQRASLIYGQRIESHRLRLDRAQCVDLARLCLESAAQVREGVRYHTTRRSCVTECVDLLNQVLPAGREVPRWLVPGVIANPRLALPKQTPGYLAELGLAEPHDAWDGSVRALRFPRPEGEDLVLDVLALPGSKVGRGVRALEEALFDYAARSRERREWDARPPGRPGDVEHRQHLEARADADERLQESLARVVDLTLADPATTVPFLLGLEPPETPQAALLIQSLLGRLGDAAAAGEWTPTDEQAEAMRRLGEGPGGTPEAEEDTRPFVRRQRQTRLVSEQDDAMVIEEFRWGFADQGEPRLVPTFQTTTVHPARIAEVFFWAESFAPKWLTAHGQLAFLMDGPGGVVGADGREADGFIYSVEGHFREGQTYSPLRGLRARSEYGIIHILTTLRDRLQQAHVLYNHSMDVYRLKLSQAQKEDLVRRALRSSATPRPDERYHTTRKSCVSESLKLVNQVLPEHERVRMWTVPGVLHNLKVSLPKWAPEMLVEEGLADYVVGWDEDITTVRLPRGDDQWVVEMASLEGSEVPASVRGLESALHQYVQGAQSLRSLQDSARDPALDAEARAALRDELAAAEGALGRVLESVVELALASPAETVPYLLDQERPDTPQAASLARALLARLNAEAAAGTWTPTARQARAIASLVAKFGV